MPALLRRSLLAAVLVAAVSASAQQPLTYWDYHDAMSAAFRLDHITSVDSLEDEFGPYLAMGDRFGLVRLFHLTDGGSRQIWVSKQLNGVVQEVVSGDLDGDDRDEIVAYTSAGVVYVWSSSDNRLKWESLTGDFRMVHSLALGQVDDDDAREIVINADNKIHYVDGETWNREWTSPMDYEATRMAIGDVDDDGVEEIVLNTGQVVDPRSGDVEWEGETFGARIQLLDMDGDGIPEVLAESDGTILRIFDVDLRREKQLQ